MERLLAGGRLAMNASLGIFERPRVERSGLGAFLHSGRVHVLELRRKVEVAGLAGGAALLTAGELALRW